MIRLLFVALVLVCSTAQGQTAAELRTHVEYLASDDLGGRYPASDGMEKAKEYVRKECKALGLEVFTQDVTVKGGTCQNIIGVLEGKRTDKRIVIGAHLDHIGTTPARRFRQPEVFNGADDNASGSAAVLALAKRLARVKPACTIEFHWYTGEEQNLLGSKQYVKRPIGEIEEYVCMINLDMVGRLKNKQLVGDDTAPLILPIPEPAIDLDEVLAPLYDKYIFAEKITWASDTRDSDHSSWWQAGVPAVILHTGLHDDYHKTTDDAEKLYYDGMVDVCHYALDIVDGVYRALGMTVSVPDDQEPFVLY